MAFLLEKAGGIATTGTEHILDIVPKVSIKILTTVIFMPFLEHSLPLSDLVGLSGRCKRVPQNLLKT